MKQIVLKKGHNIRITGIPSSDSLTLVTSKKIGVSPNSFRNVKPKLMVSEGDTVKIGTPLFYDKTKLYSFFSYNVRTLYLILIYYFYRPKYLILRLLNK